jgi:membrane protein implicated in regulation of membrane protease activity
MPAWIWLVLGISLVIFELLVPSGFFLFILGLAGIAVGALVAAGLVAGWIYEVTSYCVIAIVCWLALGKRLAGIFAGKGFGEQQQGQIVGAIVAVSSDIPVGGKGVGTLWGTQWRLENIDSAPLVAGSEAVVVASQGIMLQVKRK